jgi:hypothetical protein
MKKNLESVRKTLQQDAEKVGSLVVNSSLELRNELQEIKTISQICVDSIQVSFFILNDKLVHIITLKKPHENDFKLLFSHLDILKSEQDEISSKESVKTDQQEVETTTTQTTTPAAPTTPSTPEAPQKVYSYMVHKNKNFINYI